MPSQQAIAFFGATGGCVMAALVQSLQAGYPCRALVRNPQKLLDLLAAAGVADTSNLTLVAGGAVDQQAIKDTLKTKDDSLVPLIVFGIGAKPVFRASQPLTPTLDQPTICADGMEALVSSITSLQYTVAPKLCAISTTGLTSARDFPLAFYPLYHWLLHVPHQDKHNMENFVIGAGKAGTLSGFAIVRASLLTDGKSFQDQVRFGADEVVDGTVQEVDAKTIGYTISREDVGIWIFKNLIEPRENAWGIASGGGRVYTITY